MSSPPYSRYRISECLSEVMDEIGVNETMVMKRRRTLSLSESIDELSFGDGGKKYVFGSQIESSTTLGLLSDMDNTFIPYNFVVIQTLKELKPGYHNLMMIRNENVQPGYCYLQNSSQNNLESPVYSFSEVVDIRRRRLLRRSDNKLVGNISDRETEIHGPALTFPRQGNDIPVDLVNSYQGESLPHEVTHWLKRQRQRKGKWPSINVLKNCERSGCFAVPKGSPESDTKEEWIIPNGIIGSKKMEMEWIISTALQDRYLMFSLNITQIRCLILLKIILKTFIDPYVKDVLTSFMCKNVLWYCIANSLQNWHTGNLFSHVQLCLLMLKERIVQRNCPHFIIPENNLLAGRMSDSQQRQLLKIINNLIAKGEQFLFEIQIDNIGGYLKMKLNNILHVYTPFLQCGGLSSRYSTAISGGLVLSISMTMSNNILNLFAELNGLRLEMAISYFYKRWLILEQYSSLKDVNLFPHSKLDIVHTASKLLIPLVKSTLGSLLACEDIVSKSTISNEVLTHLNAGKESDVLSGRLKLISVLYATGDIEKTEQELKQISEERLRSEVFTLCSCTTAYYPKLPNIKVFLSFESKHEEAIKTNITFCTRFLHCETPCVPHELRYEILRSYIPEDRQMRTVKESFWMDTIVVNSICYYYFLQYKMNRHFRRGTEQQQALCNFEASARSEIPHKETSLNLLGQCFEQESRHIEALQCYIDSLKHRPINNAAKFLLCIQLYKLKLLNCVT